MEPLDGPLGLLYGHLRPLDGHFGCLDSYLNFFPNNFLFFYINEYRKGYSLPLYGSQFKDFFFLRSTPPVASLKSSRKAKDWVFYHFKDFLWIFGAFFKVFLALLHNWWIMSSPRETMSNRAPLHRKKILKNPKKSQKTPKYAFFANSDAWLRQ